MTTVNVTLSASGAESTDISDIYAGVLSDAEANSPGVAVDMPAELVSAMVQTIAGGIKAAADYYALAINTFSPYGINEYMLLQQGAQMGFELNEFDRTSVYVTFAGVDGVVIPKGTLVSDGNYQYQTIDADVVGAGGTVEIYCQATIDGSWAVPAGTVDQIITSFPTAYDLTCSNVIDGTPSAGSETIPEYRGRVLEAMQINSIATVPYLKTLLYALGIEQRLVAVSSNLQAIYVGGLYDDYQVANAIWQSGLNTYILTGSTTVTLSDYPSTYDIKFTSANSVTASLAINWKTPLTNVSTTAVSSAAKTAVAEYINSLPIGYGINGEALRSVFLNAVSGILSKQFVTSIAFVVTYDAVTITPTDSLYVLTNAYDYLTITESDITVTKV